MCPADAQVVDSRIISGASTDHGHNLHGQPPRQTSTQVVGNPQTTQAVTKTLDWFFSNHGKALLLKTKFTYFIKSGCGAQVEHSCLLTGIHSRSSYSPHHQRRKATKPCNPQCWLACMVTGTQTLREYQTNTTWLDLRLILHYRTYAWYCVGGQKSKTKYATNLGEIKSYHSVKVTWW